MAQSFEEERAPQVVEAPAAVDAVALPPASDAPELAPIREPGLLSLLSLGAAVIGAVATPTGWCRSDACLAASIIDRTAQLEEASSRTLESTRERHADRAARN